MDVSLIVTTYNWPEALRVNLDSVLGQSMKPAQVIVADDGSGPKTAQVVKDVLKPSALKWCHVWHHDKGVRQSRIKNLAVRHSEQPYLIFIDHDVVIHPDFVFDHVQNAQEGCFLQGKRCLLPKNYTEKTCSKGAFETPPFWLSGLNNRKNALRLPFLGRQLSKAKRNHEASIRGCNFSMYKSDFLAVDGFDEIFDKSWGREDSDICYRMFHRGVKVRTLWFLAVQYHLHHGGPGDWEKERLDRELQKNTRDKRVKAVSGISQLSPEGRIVATSDDQ